MKMRHMKAMLGMFVMLSVGMLAGLVVVFGGMPTLFSGHNRYTVILSSADSVTPGTAVRKSGVKIGSVESVELDNDTGKVRVHILIEKKYTIWSDEEAVLKPSLLGDSSVIEIVTKPKAFNTRPGKLQLMAHNEPIVLAAAEEPPPRTPVPPGGEIPGRVPTNPQKLLDDLTGVLPPTQQALVELGRAAESFNRIAPQFDAAIREVGALSHDTRELLPDVKRTNEEIQVTVKNWGALGERLNVLLRTNEDKIVKTLEDFDDVAKRMGQALSDENLRNWSSILRNTRTASDRFPSIAQNADEMIREARPAVRSFDETMKQAQGTMNDLRRVSQPLSNSSERITRNLDEGAERFNKIMADVQGLMQVINRQDGTVQRLIADPTLYNNLNEMVCQISKMMPTLDRALKDIEVFTDKIARHPEALGVGGAVRPSSGIK